MPDGRRPGAKPKASRSPRTKPKARVSGSSRPGRSPAPAGARRAAGGAAHLPPRRRSPAPRPASGSTPGRSGCRTCRSSSCRSRSPSSATPCAAARRGPRPPADRPRGRRRHPALRRGRGRDRVGRLALTVADELGVGRPRRRGRDRAGGRRARRIEIPGAVAPAFAPPAETAEAIATVAAGVGVVIVPDVARPPAPAQGRDVPAAAGRTGVDRRPRLGVRPHDGRRRDLRRHRPRPHGAQLARLTRSRTREPGDVADLGLCDIPRWSGAGPPHTPQQVIGRTVPPANPSCPRRVCAVHRSIDQECGPRAPDTSPGKDLRNRPRAPGTARRGRCDLGCRGERLGGRQPRRPGRRAARRAARRRRRRRRRPAPRAPPATRRAARCASSRSPPRPTAPTSAPPRTPRARRCRARAA